MVYGTCRIIVADDHELIRKGLKQLILMEESFEIVAEANNGEDAVAYAVALKPDVLILDYFMPKLSGIDALKLVKAQMPSIKIMLLTVETSLDIIKEAINFGVDAFLLKESAGNEIIDAIKHIQNNEKYIDKSLVGQLFNGIKVYTEDEHLKKPLLELSQREFDVLKCVAQGLSNKEIGEALFLSEKTIKNYLTSVFRKLNITDRLHAALYAHEHKINDIKR
jgi:DNA-binding NarL/FixJ family response regulator